MSVFLCIWETEMEIYLTWLLFCWKFGSFCRDWKGTAQKMESSIKDFFSKCDQIRRKLRIWSYLLKKSLMESFIFCLVRKQEYHQPNLWHFNSVMWFVFLLLMYLPVLCLSWFSFHRIYFFPIKKKNPKALSLPLLKIWF